MPKKLTDIEVQKRLPNGFVMLEPYLGFVHKRKFKCPLCESIFETYPESIFTGHTKSCGCLIEKSRTGEKYVSGAYFSKLKVRAARASLVMELTIPYLEQLLIQQDFKCALSGLPILMGYFHNINRSKITASLDRIDSHIGYVEGNVQWVHKEINRMKGRLSDAEFIQMCGRVVDNSIDHNS